MNKVYSWYPSKGADGKNVGHAAMDISFGQGAGMAEYVSWWPTEAASPSNGFKKLTAGVNTYPLDVSSEGHDPDVTAVVDCLDENRMRDRWKSIRAAGGYALFWKNCAHTVADVLLAGGAALSLACVDYCTHILLWTPADVYRFASLINTEALTIKHGVANGFKPVPQWVVLPSSRMFGL